MRSPVKVVMFKLNPLSFVSYVSLLYQSGLRADSVSALDDVNHIAGHEQAVGGGADDQLDAQPDAVRGIVLKIAGIGRN